MNKFDKYKIPIFISLNILVLISLFGMAYAYFKATVNNTESASTISVESGELTINYQGNTANIVASGIVPGWSETKKFTLSGKNTTKTNEFHTDNNLYYKIILAIDNNTFSEGALTYSLAKDSTSSTNGKMADEASGTINQSGNQIIGYGYFSETATFVDHIYNLTISFPSTEHEQSADNGKSFAAHVTIGEGKIKTTTFAEDSWETIASAIKNRQLDDYPVGSEKEVEIGGTSYTVRVANNTTPAECSGNDFSQTACGFVVEFVDIIENRTTGLTNENAKTYVDSEIRTYLNNAFYNKLPSDLRDNIITTNIIAVTAKINGATPIGGTLTASTSDKIFLINETEITGESIILNHYNTSTRQLDYYSSQNYNSSSNKSCAIKKYNNTASNWWIRDRMTLLSGGGYDLNIYDSTGTIEYRINLNNSYGIAPAFRIG